jgi:hypothetical protein
VIGGTIDAAMAKNSRADNMAASPGEDRVIHLP